MEQESSKNIGELKQSVKEVKEIVTNQEKKLDILAEALNSVKKRGQQVS